MKKKVIVRGPAFSRSGYGEHTRYLLRSLRMASDRFDVYLWAVGWGHTGAIVDQSEEFSWMQDLTHKFNHVAQQKGFQFDISLQVTIPGEFDPRMAKMNVGVTAGVETTKISPEWIQKINMMDKIITISNFSKESMIKSLYDARLPNGQIVKGALKVQKPIEIVRYPVRELDYKELDLQLDTEFNFLAIAQFGLRKNMEQTIKGFVDTFKNDPRIGFVIKANKANNSTKDFYVLKKQIENILESTDPKRKCKIYLLHGEMTDEEMQGLYHHPQIKAFVNIAHGEGWSIPIFDAAINEMPVIATNWSGHLDYLYKHEIKTRKLKNGKKKKIERFKPMFSPVEFELKNVQPGAVWDNIIIADSQWAFPDHMSYRRAMFEMIGEYDAKKKMAVELAAWIKEEFEEQKMMKLFADTIYKPSEQESEWMEDLEAVETF